MSPRSWVSLLTTNHPLFRNFPPSHVSVPINVERKMKHFCVLSITLLYCSYLQSVLYQLTADFLAFCHGQEPIGYGQDAKTAIEYFL